MFSAGGAVPVSTGFTWTTAFIGVLNLLVGGVLVAIIRSRPALKKIANEREANLLSERAEEMKGMRDTIAKLEARLDAKDIQHEAERAYDRHRINNLAASLNAFFILVKRHPDDAAGAAEEVEAMRARQLEDEKRESIALRQLIAGLTVPPPAT